MCSTIVQIVFGVILLAGAGLTIIALVTPSWRSFNLDGKDNYFGFFTACLQTDRDSNFCYNSWQNAPTWQKAAMACLILALLACAIAFVWSCVACFMCCCRSCLTPPLPILSGLACVLVIVGVAVYGAKSGESLGGVPTSQQALQSKGTFGYSFWVGVGAIIALFVDTIVGVCLVTTSKVSPI